MSRCEICGEEPTGEYGECGLYHCYACDRYVCWTCWEEADDMCVECSEELFVHPRPGPNPYG